VQVYRITLEKYAYRLVASGLPNRWNSSHVNIIYASCTRAMVALENIVHRSGEGLEERFRIITLEVPENAIDFFSIRQLPESWFLRKNLTITQQIGDDWIKKGTKLGLRVPSAIVPGEYNLLLNPLHQDFEKVKVLSVEPFVFDPRIKS